jgi:hypothetical protein
LTESKAFGLVDEDGCTVRSFIDGGYDIVQDLEHGKGALVYSSET